VSPPSPPAPPPPPPLPWQLGANIKAAKSCQWSCRSRPIDFGPDLNASIVINSRRCSRLTCLHCRAAAIETCSRRAAAPSIEQPAAGRQKPPAQRRPARFVVGPMVLFLLAPMAQLNRRHFWAWQRASREQSWLGHWGQPLGDLFSARASWARAGRPAPPRPARKRAGRPSRPPNGSQLVGQSMRIAGRSAIHHRAPLFSARACGRHCLFSHRWASELSGARLPIACAHRAAAPAEPTRQPTYRQRQAHARRPSCATRGRPDRQADGRTDGRAEPGDRWAACGGRLDSIG